jgi:hypothetical protein
MENLKNIRYFEEFKDSVNEELLWNAVKNLLSTLFGKMDKKFSESINNFTKKIDGTKTWEKAVKFMEQADGDVRNKFQEGLKTVTGPLGLRKLLVDTSNTVFTELQVLYNRYGQKDATPRKIFEGTPNAQMFAFDKAKDFEVSLYNSLNAKILGMNKEGKGYNEQELQTYLTNQKDINAVETAAPTNSGTTNNPPVNTTNPKGNVNQNPPDNTASDSYFSKFTDKLFEEADPPATTPASSGTKQEGGVPNGTIANLTNIATTWVNEQLLGQSLKKLQGLKPPSKVGQEDAFTAIAKNTKVTNNPESVAKLLRNIVNLPPEKKNELTQIRDILAKALGKTPEDLKNEMPF